MCPIFPSLYLGIFESLEYPFSSFVAQFIKSSLFKSAWGSYSLVECELFLLRQATKNRKYDYYHLISGMDLPLKPQKEIHEIFDKSNNIEYIHFDAPEIDSEVYSCLHYNFCR